jgi:hypothetical protein
MPRVMKPGIPDKRPAGAREPRPRADRAARNWMIGAAPQAGRVWPRGPRAVGGGARRLATVKRVLLTGMSGTGKSSVIAELAALGYKAVDTDDGWCEPLPGGRQRWREGAIAALLDTQDAGVLFIAGCQENQARFRSRFDLVILLSAPRAGHDRETGVQGRQPVRHKATGDMARILADLAAVEPLLRKSADHEIRTVIPLADVVDRVLRLAGLPGRPPPTRAAPGEHRARPAGPTTSNIRRSVRPCHPQDPSDEARRSGYYARFERSGFGR